MKEMSYFVSGIGRRGRGGQLPPGAALGGRKIDILPKIINFVAEKIDFLAQNRFFAPQKQGLVGKGGAKITFCPLAPCTLAMPLHFIAMEFRRVTVKLLPLPTFFWHMPFRNKLLLCLSYS